MISRSQQNRVAGFVNLYYSEPRVGPTPRRRLACVGRCDGDVTDARMVSGDMPLLSRRQGQGGQMRSDADGRIPGRRLGGARRSEGGVPISPG